MGMVVLKDRLGRLKRGRLVRIKQLDLVDEETFRRHEVTRMRFEIQRVDTHIGRGPNGTSSAYVGVTLLPAERERFIASLSVVGSKPMALVVSGRVLYVGPITSSLWWEPIRVEVPSKAIADSFALEPR